ncbi:TPA: O-antigen ligase family protein [Mannheimia haemolytica]
MFLNVNKIEKTQITLFVNILVAAFFVTVLTFKKGYSYVPITLGVIATLSFLYYRFKLKIKWQLDKEDKYFIFSLIGYFLTFVMSAIFNGDGVREIDNPSRILLLIPLIFFFNLYPIKKEIVFHFIPIGAFLVGIIAIYQKFILKLPKPFPETMHIQAGNISILLGLLSISIAFYWFSEKKNKIAILYILFSAFGLLASILTGARGGWIAFPFCFLLILIFNLKHINKKMIIFISVLLSVALSIFIARPEFGIQQRYNEAESDIVAYFEKGNKNSSLGARFDMWENALTAISKKPILGHGSIGYDDFREKQIKANQMAETTTFNSLHNQYLEAFVKRGIIGFISLISIMVIPLMIFSRRLKNYDNSLKCISILGIIHIISHSFFFLSQSFLAHNSGSIFYFFILILLYHLVRYKEKNI